MALPSLAAETQIQLAIRNESDRGTDYQIGKLLDLIVAATARFDGHSDSPPGTHGGQDTGPATGLSPVLVDVITQLGGGNVPALRSSGLHSASASQNVDDLLSLDELDQLDSISDATPII